MAPRPGQQRRQEPARAPPLRRQRSSLKAVKQLSRQRRGRGQGGQAQGQLRGLLAHRRPQRLRPRTTWCLASCARWMGGPRVARSCSSCASSGWRSCRRGCEERCAEEGCALRALGAVGVLDAASSSPGPRVVSVSQ
jgi:hypothetical protein